MKIDTVKINNYKAFYGENTIDIKGKNLIVYGENGSGKSSFYNALNVFFEATSKKVYLEENIFIEDSAKDSVFIELTFKDKENPSKSTTYKIDRENTHIDSPTLSDTNKIKGFFDYKKLLKTHFIDKQKVDIFDILVKDILYHSQNSFSSNTLGEDWEKINELKMAQKNTQQYKDCEELLGKFNQGLKEKLDAIKDRTNDFIKYFNYGITLSFKFKDIIIFGKEKSFKGNEVILEIEFYNKKIDKHHTFFNEARLTALGISLYLTSILNNPLAIEYKILFLDDLLIGLDMSNRIPLIQILNNHFKDFQIIITTYDKAWFEVLKSYLPEWNNIEIYTKSIGDNKFEIPIIYHSNSDFISKAEFYLRENDYKASAVYVRSEFEKIIKTVCHKNHFNVKYDKQAHKVDSNSFWETIKDNTDLSSTIIQKIELHRTIVMNPFSHHTLNKPEFRAELESAIEAVKELKLALKSIKRINTIKALKTKVSLLEKQLEESENQSSSEEFNFEKDIYDILLTIKTTDALNSFLRMNIYNDITKFQPIEFERLLDELQIAQKVTLFDLDTEAILIRIFSKYEWSEEHQNRWCSFVKFLDEKNKLKDPYFVQKLEDKNCLRRQWNNDEYYIECRYGN